MNGEWREVSIEEIATKIAMGPFGSDIKTDNFVPFGVPVIRGGNLTSGRFSEKDFVFLTEEKADQLLNANAFPGDLVLTHRGTLGQVGLIPVVPFKRYVVSQSQMKLTCNPNAADAGFLYYFFKSPTGQHALLQNTSQTGVPAISRPVTSLKRIRLLLPPLSEQRAIAHILGTLDDKIELNRRMNATLEKMARALFKSWFVDFDPVRAKMEGRDTGLPAEIAVLFPDGFEESELGEVPRGWKVGSYLEVADLLSGGTPSTSVAEYWNGDIPWVSAKDVSGAAGSFLLQTEKTISQLGVDNSSTKVLPAFTTIITARGTVGGYCLLGREMAMNQTNYGLRAKPGVGDYFIFFSTAEMIEHLRQQAYGTIFDTVTTKTFRDTMRVQPPLRLLAEFEAISGPTMERVLSNEQQSCTLAALRDALLPELISGGLRVADAKQSLC